MLTNLGTDETEKPNPNFWSFLVKFLHKQDVKEIHTFTQLTTEVGFCRAFIRKSLNQSLLSSYLQNARDSSSALNKHYHRYAFLCDNDLVTTAIDLLQGIENYVTFKLPCNSSLLNMWNDNSLQMAGLYVVQLKYLPFGRAEEALDLINESEAVDIPKQNPGFSGIYNASISNSVLSTSPNSTLNFEEEDQMARLLRKMESVKDELTEELSHTSDKMCESMEDENTDNQMEQMNLPLDNNNHVIADVECMELSQDEMTPDNTSVMGNSILNNANTWNDPIEEEKKQEEIKELQQEEEVAHSSRVNQRSNMKTSTIDASTFESLLNEKKRKSSTDFHAVWNRYIKNTNKPKQTTIPEDSDFPEDFVVLRNENPDSNVFNELQQMVEILCRLSTENGLDAQGFLCKHCRLPLINIADATVCGFDALYYCSSCISKDKYAIPAKIIYNWDFTQYSVSNKAAEFISDYQFKPFIDFKILNPDIYSHISEMNSLQNLRIQLNFLRAYIFTCSESSIMEMQKLLYGKEYIYESIHLYSVADLYLIQNGALEEMLKKVVNVARDHCLNCVLCKNKGFICEYCRRSKIIYPFDVDETNRCNQCGTVFHINCYNPLIPCPRCTRKHKRQIALALESEN
jgi:hypothetical protein